MKRIVALVSTVAAVGIVATSGSATTAKRSGALHVTKECSEYFGGIGEFCTITSSNIAVIKPGMRVFYFASPGPAGLDSDIALSSGQGGAAVGHVVLDFATNQGRVTFSAGTGTFRGFHADVAVSVDASGVWHWDGTYSFTRGGGGGDDDGDD
jgi:hypothetical protein